ncbi:MAG: hypothetical protein LLG44_04515 [Chloroflexi bacterium]|nr:hypothetical protein [Chloroflexota bacterium]
MASGGTIRRPPPVDLLGINDQFLKQWMAPRMVPQPIATYTQPVRTGSAWDAQFAHAYVLCTEGPLAPYMAVFAEQAKAAGWPVRELAYGHDVMVTAPATLADVLDELASESVHTGGEV